MTPRALVFVDRAFARTAVRIDAEPEIWAERESELGDQPLSAPLEAHLQLEEATIFPALVAALTQAELDVVEAEMKARRSD